MVYNYRPPGLKDLLQTESLLRDEIIRQCWLQKYTRPCKTYSDAVTAVEREQHRCLDDIPIEVTQNKLIAASCSSDKSPKSK